MKETHKKKIILTKKKILCKKKETPSTKFNHENYIDLPKMDKKKFALLLALYKHHGLVSYACASAKVSRKQFYRYLDEDEVFREAAGKTKEITLDLAECKLIKKINEESEKSIHFCLDRIGRSRGYGKHETVEYDPTEKQTMTMGGVEIEF